MNRAKSRRKPAGRFSDWLPALAVFALAIALRGIVPANSDVSWDITVAEKVLAGARLYVDVIEVNPPATIYLYLPATAFAHFLALKPEWAVNAFVFLLAGASLWFTSRLASSARLLPQVDGRIAAACIAFLLLVLPARVFGEREHVALIVALPAILVFVLVAEGRKVSWAAQVIAGAGAGLMAIIKPHLMLGIVFAAAAAAISVRSWRPFFVLQNWVAAFLCALYALWVWIAFPAFFTDVMPLVLATYVPLKATLVELLFQSGLLLWLAGFPIVWWLQREKILQPMLLVPLAASTGFALAYLMQGKVWPYQSFPAIAVSAYALMLAFLLRFHGGRTRAGDRAARLAAVSVVSLIVGLGFFWFSLALDVSAANANARAIAPHPKIIALSGDLGVGHPLTREVGGTWVGRQPSLWVTTFVRLLRNRGGIDPATDAKLSAYAARERDGFAEDVLREKPDIILLDRVSRFDWLAWAKADPRLAAALNRYREGKTAGGVTILSRDSAP
jgi:hypothetical protein